MISHVLLQNVTQAFTEFFYGDAGSFFGLLVMIILMVVLVKLWKYAVIILIPFIMYFGLEYFDRDMRWQTLIIFTTLVFFIGYLVKQR